LCLTKNRLPRSSQISRPIRKNIRRKPSEGSIAKIDAGTKARGQIVRSGISGASPISQEEHHFAVHNLHGIRTSKKFTNQGENNPYHAREDWWCSFGVNVGFEQDGTDSNPERRVPILKDAASTFASSYRLPRL